MTFWTAREDGDVLGCGALKLLESPPGAALHGEVKSIVYFATGTADYFAPARRLCARNGFTECPPFAGYALDPNSVFMELRFLGRPSGCPRGRAADIEVTTWLSLLPANAPQRADDIGRPSRRLLVGRTPNDGPRIPKGMTSGQ